MNTLGGSILGGGIDSTSLNHPLTGASGELYINSENQLVIKWGSGVMATVEPVMSLVDHLREAGAPFETEAFICSTLEQLEADVAAQRPLGRRL